MMNDYFDIIYIIPIIIGFGIDFHDYFRWIIYHLKGKMVQRHSFGCFSTFVLPAWGISGLMIFGLPPEQILDVWDKFKIVLIFAFLAHMTIREVLPALSVMILNIYYGKNILDLSCLYKNNL